MLALHRFQHPQGITTRKHLYSVLHWSVHEGLRLQTSYNASQSALIVRFWVGPMKFESSKHRRGHNCRFQTVVYLCWLWAFLRWQMLPSHGWTSPWIQAILCYYFCAMPALLFLSNWISAYISWILTLSKSNYLNLFPEQVLMPSFHWIWLSQAPDVVLNTVDLSAMLLLWLILLP